MARQRYREAANSPAASVSNRPRAGVPGRLEQRSLGCELKRNLIAVLLAHATNLGLTRMADACGIPYDVLAWTAEWYVREETLRAANLAIIGYHRKLLLAPVFGVGTLSSSGGQRFPTRGKSVTASGPGS